MTDVLFYAVQFIVTLAAFILGKYVFPRMKKSGRLEAFETIYQWAKSFIAYCSEFKKAQSGEEKMDYLVNEIAKLCKDSGLCFTEEQIRAIGQRAYDEVKKNKEAIQ